ncbi:NAD-dependent epimerase/dehydratase family protein [Streptomyces sp. NPDC047525]|uniref:NAD-dependent epimerase/dehydratase family protein n=1 Tax=Streptomyces sp. NPDC047525 TaxID=3155264 RepID=UPI0034038C52
MRILVMGGTWFLGRYVVEGALRRGWDVTTFNRGRTGKDMFGVEAVHGDRTVVQDLRRLASHGPWDAVIDTSNSELAPRVVQFAARDLAEQAGRWVHISTVSVYAGWPHHPLTVDSEVLVCPADADESRRCASPATTRTAERRRPGASTWRTWGRGNSPTPRKPATSATGVRCTTTRWSSRRTVRYAEWSQAETRGVMTGDWVGGGCASSRRGLGRTCPSRGAPPGCVGRAGPRSLPGVVLVAGVSDIERSGPRGEAGAVQG